VGAKPDHLAGFPWELDLCDEQPGSLFVTLELARRQPVAAPRKKEIPLSDCCRRGGSEQEGGGRRGFRSGRWLSDARSGLVERRGGKRVWPKPTPDDDAKILDKLGLPAEKKECPCVIGRRAAALVSLLWSVHSSAAKHQPCQPAIIHLTGQSSRLVLQTAYEVEDHHAHSLQIGNAHSLFELLLTGPRYSYLCQSRIPFSYSWSRTHLFHPVPNADGRVSHANFIAWICSRSASTSQFQLTT
jgi:hypothetical protein